jgi:hypothetical protein
MRAQATQGDHEDRSHPLRRACPDRSYRISQPRQGEEGPLMRTWQPCLCPCVVHGLEKMESSKVFQVKKEVQG